MVLWTLTGAALAALLKRFILIPRTSLWGPQPAKKILGVACIEVTLLMVSFLPLPDLAGIALYAILALVPNLSLVRDEHRTFLESAILPSNIGYALLLGMIFPALTFGLPYVFLRR